MTAITIAHGIRLRVTPVRHARRVNTLIWYPPRFPGCNPDPGPEYPFPGKRKRLEERKELSFQSHALISNPTLFRTALSFCPPCHFAPLSFRTVHCHFAPLCHFERSEKSLPPSYTPPLVSFRAKREIFSPVCKPHKISPHFVRRNDRVRGRSRFFGVIPAAVLPRALQNIVISSAARNLRPRSIPSTRHPLTRHTPYTRHPPTPRHTPYTLSFRAQREIFPPTYTSPRVSFRAKREIFSSFCNPRKISPHFVRRNDKYFFLKQQLKYTYYNLIITNNSKSREWSSRLPLGDSGIPERGTYPQGHTLPIKNRPPARAFFQ